MNNRIKELAEKSGCDPKDVAYFAELIIQECIGQVEEGCFNSGDEWDKSRLSAIKDIKEHFGIRQ